MRLRPIFSLELETRRLIYPANMAQRFGKFGPTCPRLGKLVYKIALPAFQRLCLRRNLYDPSSAYAQDRILSMRQKLSRGEPVYLLGVAVIGHNAGVSLVEATLKDGVRLLCNHEEERFSGIKHDRQYPRLAVETLKLQM